MTSEKDGLLKSLEKIKNDKVHGSTYLILKVFEVLEREIINNFDTDEDIIITDALNMLNNSHAEMVEFNTILNKLKENPSLEQVRTLKNAYISAKDKVARILADQLRQSGISRILTLSHSSLVENGLIYWENHMKSEKNIEIHILESRPLKEGRILLKRLNSRMKKAKFYYWVDAAMGIALNFVDCVLLGIDRMYDDGCIVNKIGSLPLAILAKEKSVPVLAIGTSFKMDGSTCPHDPKKYEGIKRPASEVLEEDFVQATNITVMNFYFELVPAQYISKIIIEQEFD